MKSVESVLRIVGRGLTKENEGGGEFNYDMFEELW
jgi:hypothetical protein